MTDGADGKVNKKKEEPRDALLLAIDHGTQSVRALAFDLSGGLVAKSKIDLEPYFSEHAGWAEQHAEYYWQMTIEALLLLWDQLGPAKDKISGMAVTTQRATVISLDSAGKPLRPAISWLDQRTLERSELEGLAPLGAFWNTLFAVLGQRETVGHFRSQAESLWIKKNQPTVWTNTDKFVFLSGYLHYQLAGSFVDSSASQVGYIPYNFKRHRWPNALDWKWRATQIKRSQLPTLRRPGEVIGSISKQAAKATGIPEGLPIIAAGADKACEILGSGCVTPDTAALSFGTAATVNTANRRYVEAYPFIPPYPGAMPEIYCTEVQITRGFWMINWFKQQLASQEVHDAKVAGVAPEKLFDDLIKDVPAGSLGLILQPYWSPGVKSPGLEAKGGIIGFGEVHTKAHIYRAILEGLAYALREGKERLEKRNKTPITRLRVSGGGSQSDKAMQITADVFGLPAQRPHTFETSGLGAAMNVAVGLGLHDDYETALEKMVHTQDTFTPNPQSQEVYEQLYQRVYLRLYERLQPLYHDIREITGYPD